MSTFILVHGAWHGAWCWEKLIPLLEEHGHKAIAIDLPFHGKDKTPLRKISFSSYTKSLINLIDKQNEPVILVGHSQGGVVITDVAEQIPNKILKLVYLAAFVPINISFLRLAISDQHSCLKHYLKVKGFKLSIDKEFVEKLFYGDCSNKDVTNSKERLGFEPIIPLLKKIKVTDKRFGNVEKIYIKTLNDMAISPQMQDHMCQSTKFSKIIEIETSHSPFYSIPNELAEILINEI